MKPDFEKIAIMLNAIKPLTISELKNALETAFIKGRKAQNKKAEKLVEALEGIKVYVENAELPDDTLFSNHVLTLTEQALKEFRGEENIPQKPEPPKCCFINENTNICSTHGVKHG